MLRRVCLSGIKKATNLGPFTQFGRFPQVCRMFSAQSKNEDIPVDAEHSDKDFQPKIRKGNEDSDSSTKTDDQIREQIHEWVQKNRVVLFMKGTPQMPMCGYSRYVVETLKFYQIRDYKAVDVLKDQNLKRVIKEFSDWPTFPQLYVNGSLVGGKDIIEDMHKDGSLKDVLSKEM